MDPSPKKQAAPCRAAPCAQSLLSTLGGLWEIVESLASLNQDEISVVPGWIIIISDGGWELGRGVFYAKGTGLVIGGHDGGIVIIIIIGNVALSRGR